MKYYVNKLDIVEAWQFVEPKFAVDQQRLDDFCDESGLGITKIIKKSSKAFDLVGKAWAFCLGLFYKVKFLFSIALFIAICYNIAIYK